MLLDLFAQPEMNYYSGLTAVLAGSSSLRCVIILFEYREASKALCRRPVGDITVYLTNTFAARGHEVGWSQGGQSVT